MGMFAKIGESKVTAGGVYFEPGKYKVKIEGVKTQVSARSGKSMFIIECEILETSNPERPVGLHASQVIDIQNIMGLPNIKGFVAAASGLNAMSAGNEEVNRQVCAHWSDIMGRKASFEEVCEFIVGADQPLEGQVLGLECSEIMTREKRQPFTKHVWFPLDA